MDREGLIKEFSLKIASKVVREFEGNDNYTVHDLRNYTELLLNELVSENESLHLVSYCECCDGTGYIEGEHYDDIQACLTCNGSGR
jgi:DnaJ-class molecular chaperone